MKSAGNSGGPIGGASPERYARDTNSGVRQHNLKSSLLELPHGSIGQQVCRPNCKILWHDGDTELAGRPTNQSNSCNLDSWPCIITKH